MRSNRRGLIWLRAVQVALAADLLLAILARLVDAHTTYAVPPADTVLALAVATNIAFAAGVLLAVELPADDEQAEPQPTPTQDSDIFELRDRIGTVPSGVCLDCGVYVSGDHACDVTARSAA